MEHHIPLIYNLNNTLPFVFDLVFFAGGLISSFVEDGVDSVVDCWGVSQLDVTDDGVAREGVLMVGKGIVGGWVSAELGWVSAVLGCVSGWD